MTTTNTVPKHGSEVLRQDIQQTQKWHIEDIFASLSEWEATCKTLKNRLKDLSAFKGKLYETEKLLNCLALLDELSQFI